MSRSLPIWLASSIALIAMATAARAQPSCPPAVVVDGDEALAAEAARLLAARGVGREAAAGCTPIVVQIARAGEHIALWIDDGDRRRSERTVRDLTTAVAIIESWTLHEIATPPPLEQGVVRPVPAAVSSGTTSAAPSVSRLPRWGVGVGLASAYAAGGSAWLGASVSGCVRVGPLCLGGLVRAGVDDTAGDDTTFEPVPGAGHGGVEELAGSSGFDALATVDVVWAPWGLVLRPGVGAGPGWVTVDTTTHHMGEVTTQEHRGRVLRLDAHLAVSRRLVSGLALELVLRADTALLRDGELEGPSSFARATLGVRYEVP